MNTTTTTTGFDVHPNRHDVRIVCRTCGESKSGSLARSWAHSHSHTL